MSKVLHLHRKKVKKIVTNTQIRKKLGLTQAELGSIFGFSRGYITMAELGKRNLHATTNTVLTNMYNHFLELETGVQSAERSTETRLFLNDEYKKILPKMKALELDCRYKVKELKKKMVEMKELARDKEHAIIVFTKTINDLEKDGSVSDKKSMQIRGMNLFKEKAYHTLLTCWEPEQAKLHARIEALAGQAKALRRYRTKVIREHDPLKD